MTTPLVIRVLLADDHVVVRRGLRLLLDREPDIRVVAEAGDGLEAVQVGLREEIDLAVLDVSMPGMTGIHAAAELTAQRPDVRVLMLSMHESEQYLFEALKAGASGYVLKSAADRDLVEACRAAVRGETALPAGALSLLATDVLESARQGDFELPDPLTTRELQVLKLIAEAHSGEEIGEALHISPKTVDRHRTNIMDKLGLRDRVELARYAIRRGLVEP